MKLHHFKEVVRIAEQGSIRAAARSLNMAQPALTRSLADLERELGASLFERRARGVVTTTFGDAFVRRAAVILNEMRRTRDDIDQLRGATTGSVTVGLSIAAHISLLSPSLQPFRRKFPQVRLNVIEGLYPTLQGGLTSGSVDFYVGPDCDGHVSTELTREELFDGRRTILCRTGHPLASAKSLGDLCDGEWMSTSITADARDEIRGVFEKNNLSPPKIAMRGQSALTLLICLTSTDLLAMVPTQWTELAMIKGVLDVIHVREELEAPSIVLVTRGGLPLTPAATYLLDLMRRAGRSMDR